jgi:ketosteroid isomerase-like protein
MRAIFVALLLLSAMIPARAQEGRDEGLIRVMLQAQAAEWNRGNIEGYLVGYWQSDSLVFLGKSGPTYGYKATLERYKKSYPDAASMGQLTTTILKIRLLSPDYAYVTGRWDLVRTAGNLSGYYTLLLRKTGSEWIIIEDHSS